MSTRSLTTLIDDFTGKEIVAIYRHSDGYPSGQGKDLAEFLKTVKVTNGFSVWPPEWGPKKIQANGMSSLTALLVQKLLEITPSIYINAPGSFDMGEEYFYTIKGGADRELTMEVRDCPVDRKDPRKAKPMFSGTPDEFLEWLKKGEKGEQDE